MTVTEVFVPEPFHLPLWLQLTLIAILLCLSGLFSGLNLGLMALDQNDLKVIASCGTKQEKKYAATILPLRSRGNYLLCTLLLGNVLVNTTLTTLLDDVSGSGLLAVIIATLSITVIGEILPQAICSRHGLAVGAKTIAIPYLFMALTAPLSYPISRLLDLVLGEEIGCVYNREQLMEYIRITREYNRLEDNEVGIISGALALKSKVAGDILTPIEEVFSLPVETKLNYSTVTLINERGFSRIPVYADSDPSNIVGLLHTRDLALIDPGDCVDIKTVLEYHNHPLVYVYTDTRLDLVLEEFKKGKSHMALVRSIQTKVIRETNYKRNSRKISVVDGDIFNQDKYRRLTEDKEDGDRGKDLGVSRNSDTGGKKCPDVHDEDDCSKKLDTKIDIEEENDCKRKLLDAEKELTRRSLIRLMDGEDDGKKFPEDHTDGGRKLSDANSDLKSEDIEEEVESENVSEEGDPYYRLDGIITLEDIIEEILGAEIVDESDILAIKMRDKLKEKGISSSKKYSTITSPYYLSSSRGSGQVGSSGQFGSSGHSHQQQQFSGLSSQRPSMIVPLSAPTGSVPSSLTHHPLSKDNYPLINCHNNHQHTYPDFNCSTNDLKFVEKSGEWMTSGKPLSSSSLLTSATDTTQQCLQPLLLSSHGKVLPTSAQPAIGQRPGQRKNGRFLLRMSSSPTFKNVPLINQTITSTTINESSSSISNKAMIDESKNNAINIQPNETTQASSSSQSNYSSQENTLVDGVRKNDPNVGVDQDKDNLDHETKE